MKNTSIARILEDIGPSLNMEPFSNTLQPLIEETLVELKKIPIQKGDLFDS